MKRLILGIFLAIFLISMVAAVEPSYFEKQYSPAYIKIPCIDEDSNLCSSTTNCNVTVIDPEGLTLIDNDLMIRQQSFYEYNVTSNQTTKLGPHPTSINCYGGTASGFTSYDYEVTTTGKKPQLVAPLTLLLSSLFLFVVGLLAYNKPIGFLSGLLFMMSGVYVMIYGLGNIADLYTRSIAGIAIALGAIVSLTAAYEMLYD